MGKLEYFSHDFNARNDKKLVKVFMKYGLEGIGLFWCIIEMLYEESGYLNIDEYERIAFELRIDKNVIENLINDFDLFESDGERFWSESVIDRLKMRMEKSVKARESVQKRWEKYKGNTNVKQSDNEGNTSKVKERKEKEVKEVDKPSPLEIKKSKEEKFKSRLNTFTQYTDQMKDDFFDYWTESNENSTQLRYEKEKTFDIGRRLAKWKSNEVKFNGSGDKQTKRDFRTGSDFD